MSKPLTVTPSNPSDDKDRVPVTVPLPSWAFHTYTWEGYLLHEGQWSNPVRGDGDHGPVELSARLSGGDQLRMEPDGEIVAEREEPSVQLRIGSQTTFLPLSEAAQFAHSVLAAVQEASSGRQQPEHVCGSCAERVP